MDEDLFDVIASDKGGEASDQGPERAAPDRVALRLRVHVRPGAGRSAVVGKHGDALAVRVAAPPVAGRANAACAELLRDVLGVRDVELVRGERSADKRFVLSDVDLAAFRQRLHEVLEEAGAHRGTGRRSGPGRR